MILRFNFILVLFISCITTTIFGHGVPNRGNNPFSKADVAHGYHLHVPIDYVIGEGMSYGLTSKLIASMHIALAPIFSLNGDKYTRLINLEVYNEGDDHNFNSGESGYIYKQNKSFTIALGIDFHLTFGLPVTSFSLLPQRTKYTYVERRVASKKDIKCLPKKVTIPSNEEELAKWKVGDRLFYKKNSSLTFMADAGLEPVLYTGVLVNVTGNWVVGFEKLSPNKMRFSVTKEKVLGLGAEFDGLVFSIGVEKFKGRDRLFQFDLDLSSEQARHALLDLMKGKMEPAQEAARNMSSGVEEVDYRIARSKGLNVFQVFVIPFLWATSHSKTRVHTTELEEEILDDTKEVSSAVIDQVGTAGHLSKHKLRMAISFSNLEIDENDEKTFAGAHSWIYEKEDMDDDDIKDRLLDLADRIGLDHQLNFSKLSKKKGYAKIQFLNQLSMAAIIQLVNEVNDQSRSMWLVYFENSLRSYFDRNSSLRGFDDSNKEYKKLMKKGEKYLNKIIEHLRDAKSYMLKGKYKKFTSEVSKAINYIHKHPALFSCFMRRIDGFELHLALEGKNVPIQTKKLIVH
ncbi:MAG: hypothetical protein AB8G05_04865 [Oligoflexales bacterium]